MEYRIIDNTLVLTPDAGIYPETVLFKCFYWYGGNYSVSITNAPDGCFIVSLEPLKEFEAFPGFEALIEQVKKDLVDFKLRDIVNTETKNIRELIVAKAFAYYDLEEDPLTLVSDPVGFDPKLIS